MSIFSKRPSATLALLAARGLVALVSLNVLLVASSAESQIEDLVQINTLAPAAAGGCYVGTSGSDATMFIRLYPGAQGCNLFNLNPDLCLARRETPADGPNGRAVSFGDMAQLRPSVYADGTVVFFVNNLDLCVMLTSSFQQEACYSLPPTYFVHGVSAQPQGQSLALIPRDLNNIDYPANAFHIFGIGDYPSLNLLATFQFNSPLLYPETVDLMTRGPWIVFDASTTPTIGGQLGLYLVDRNTGVLHGLAPPVAGYELRNPVFGQTSDDVITFEAIDTSTGGSTVLTANIVTGDVRKIADVAITTAIPSFNGDDSAVVFNREDAGAYSTVSLRERPLSADRITPSGVEQSHLVNGGYATIYRRGTFDDSAVACPEPTFSVGLFGALLAACKLVRSSRASEGAAAARSGRTSGAGGKFT